MWPFRRLFDISRRLDVMEGHLDQSVHMTVIGGVTITWAMLEIGLDKCNHTILHRCGGEAIQADMPRSLSSKISFFKKAHARLALLSPYRVEAAQMAEQVLLLKEKRHDLIHGMARSQLENGAYVVHRHTYDGATLGQKQSLYTDKEIIQLASDIGTLSEAVINHASALIDRFPREDSSDD
jgi:hypothetical protein